MKKTLIALSLAALPVAAFADVTLSGQVRTAVEVGKTNHTHKGKVHDEENYEFKLREFGSRIGFKGHEHLDNDLKFLWAIHLRTPFNVKPSNVNTVADNFIGLSGDFGTVKAGWLPTPVSDVSDTDAGLSTDSANGLGVFTRHGKRKLSARYDSPEFAGVKVNVQVAPKTDKEKISYHAGASYKNSGFFVQYGVDVQEKDAANKKDTFTGSVHRIEAGYKADGLNVVAGYQYADGFDSYLDYVSKFEPEFKKLKSLEAVKDIGKLKEGLKDVEGIDGIVDNVIRQGFEQEIGASNPDLRLKTHELAVTASYAIGDVTPRVSYAYGFDVKPRDEDNSVKNTGYHQVVVGADYKITKRTTAFLSAGWLKFGSDAEDSILGATSTSAALGVTHKF